MADETLEITELVYISPNYLHRVASTMTFEMWKQLLDRYVELQQFSVYVPPVTPFKAERTE